jgi:hypothetical protein
VASSKGPVSPSCLGTSAVNRQAGQLQGIAATVTVGVLVGAVLIASAMELVLQQHGPHYLVKTAQAAVVAALAVAVFLVISFLAQMLRPRRQDRRQ